MLAELVDSLADPMRDQCRAAYVAELLYVALHPDSDLLDGADDWCEQNGRPGDPDPADMRRQHAQR